MQNVRDLRDVIRVNLESGTLLDVFDFIDAEFSCIKGSVEILFLNVKWLLVYDSLQL